MIVQFLISVACILFLASIPVTKTMLGAALRRWGCFLIALAFVPSVVFGVLREAVRASTPRSFLGVVEELLTFLIVAAIAYAILAWRKRASAEKKPKRIAMKQPVDPPGARPDLLNMLRDQLRNDGGGDEHDE